MSKLESLQKIGHRFFVRHPKFRGEGTLFFKNGKYTYMPAFSSTIELSESEVIKILT